MLFCDNGSEFTCRSELLSTSGKNVSPSVNPPARFSTPICCGPTRPSWHSCIEIGQAESV